MSVLVKPITGCRHGNQLCQYFAGRIISEKLKFKLFGITKDYREFCLNGVDLVYNQEGYQAYEAPIQLIGNNNPDIKLEDVYNDTTPRRIILDGYFQKKAYYAPFKEELKQWYGFKKYNIPSNDVVIHIRLGDLRETNHPDLLPHDYYVEALKMIDNPGKITICSDTPTDEYVQYFVKKYNAEIFLGNEKETICFMASHNNLILSVGTFSYWAGFFSDGTNIINAIPTKGNNRISPDNTVDLLVQGPNYKYITL